MQKIFVCKQSILIFKRFPKRAQGSHIVRANFLTHHTHPGGLREFEYLYRPHFVWGQIELWKFRPFLWPKVWVPRPAGFGGLVFTNHPVYTPPSGSFNYRLWRIGLTHGRRMRSWENVKSLIRIWDNHGEEVDDNVPAKHEIVYLVNPPLPPEKVGLTENCQRSNFSKLLINANSIHKSRFFLSQDEQHWVTLCIGMPGHKVINRLRATSQETNN